MAKLDADDSKVSDATVDAIHAWAKEHRPDLDAVKYDPKKGFVFPKPKKKK